jgi:uncharacterized membrane protein
MTGLAAERDHPHVFITDRLVLAMARHWLPVVNALSGLWLGLAVVAPLLMAAGMYGPAGLLYRFFSFQCHQLPQRSYFLFGQAGGIHTYSLQQVLTWGADPSYLRAFLGNPQIGFKIAFDMRMTAMHAALFVGGLLWGIFGKRLPRLSLRGYLLLILPMALDGGSHLVSEVTGLGFRGNNAWAVWLTGGILPADFYTGTTFGTLNWLLRTVTGTLFGLATIWLALPYLAEGFDDARRQLEWRLRRAGATR